MASDFSTQGTPVDVSASAVPTTGSVNADSVADVASEDRERSDHPNDSSQRRGSDNPQRHVAAALALPLPAFPFRFDRSMQAAAYILRKAGGALHVVKLLRMLYIADREVMFEGGTTITSDRYLATDSGVVHLRMSALMRGDDSRSLYWERFIQHRASVPSEVELADDPGDGKLSRMIENALDSVWERFDDADPADAALATCRTPEWAAWYRPGECVEIPWTAILQAGGMEDWIPCVELDRRSDEALFRLHGRI